MSNKLTAYKGDVYIPVYGSIADAQVYLKSKADKVIANQKYKRCLAMARWCEAMRGHYLSYEEPKWFWYREWHKRCLGLAEKFKEMAK